MSKSNNEYCCFLGFGGKCNLPGTNRISPYCYMAYLGTPDSSKCDLIKRQTYTSPYSGQAIGSRPISSIYTPRR